VQARLVSWFNGIVAWWKSLERRRKLYYGGAAALVALALFALIFVQANPTRVVIYQGSDYVETMNMKSALNAEDIRYWENGMLISVREQDVDRANVAMILSGQGSRTNWHMPDALDAMGLTASRTVIDLNTRMAHQTRIENMLLLVRGIVEAQVELGLPADSSLFMPSSEVPRASVGIQTNNLFDKNSGDTLARLVQSAVIGLELENVYIYNQNAEVIFSGELSETGNFNHRREFEQSFYAQIDRAVKSILGPLFGQVHTAPSLFFDYTNTLIESLEFTSPLGPDSPTGLIDRDITIRESSEMTDIAEQPGIAANNLITYPAGGGGTGNRSYFESQRDFINNRAHTLFEDNKSGEILRSESSIAVTAANLVTLDERYFNNGSYNDLFNIPPGTTWEQFRINTPDTRLLPLDEQHQRLLEHVRIATGLQNVALIVMERMVFIDEEIRPVPVNEIVMLTLMSLVILLLAYGLLKRQKPVEIGDIEPELSVEDLLVSTQIDEEKEKEMEEEERLREIKLQKDSETKQQIEKFVDLRPEAAAQLLRNWLNEDWD